jgi:energy-converting hydrogenase Eha subunit H
MIIDASVIRFLLFFCLVAMAAFGLVYLSRRQLSVWGYIFCLTVIICLPLFGPFWVIAARPGKRRPGVSPNPPDWFLQLYRKVNR